MIKSDNDSINVQYLIQAAQMELNKVRRNRFLKALPIQGVLHKNRPAKRIIIFLYTLLCSQLDKFTVSLNMGKGQ